MARAVLGAGQVTEALVVVLRTLGPAITHVVSMQTRPQKTAAAIEPGTGEAATLFFIHSAGAVLHPVAPDVDGQAVTVARTVEVGLGTNQRAVVPVEKVERLVEDVSTSVEVREKGRFGSHHHRVASRPLAVLFVCLVCTVDVLVASLSHGHTLKC